MPDLNLLTIAIAAISAAISAFMAYLTYKNLQELKFTRIEEARAYIIVSFERVQREHGWRIVIKNYGKSPGTLIKISVDPPLTYEKMDVGHRFPQLPILTDATNIYLAPGQCVTSAFEFNHYQDKIFNLTVEYSTMNKEYSDNYTIDLNYRSGVYHFGTFASGNVTPAMALEKIAENSEWFFEKQF